MLTDIFAYRYEDTPIWQTFGEDERRLLVQALKIVSEQLYPYWKGGKEDPVNKGKWSAFHDKLAMELGLQELSPRVYWFDSQLFGQPVRQTATHTMDHVCRTFVCAEFKGTIPADTFMKDRISFIEIAFREREEDLKEINAKFQQNVQLVNAFGKFGTPSIADLLSVDKNTAEMVARNQSLNNTFTSSVHELNERFRRAGCKLHYHNGFIQLSVDELTLKQVEEPFWGLVSGNDWKNVDYDMKEAVDKRDTGDRDPAFYAAKALESTIKIISKKKGWTTGKENGASNYIDNLFRGGLVIVWEREGLKNFFTYVRNPFSHGPGDAAMPELSPPQTDWAIEFCMIWIKNLIKRLANFF